MPGHWLQYAKLDQVSAPPARDSPLHAGNLEAMVKAVHPYDVETTCSTSIRPARPGNGSLRRRNDMLDFDSPCSTEKGQPRPARRRQTQTLEGQGELRFVSGCMWAWAKYRHCLAAFDTCEGKKLTELSQMQEMEHLEERQRKILCLSSLLLHLDGLAGYPAQWIGCLPEHEKAWMCSVRRGIDWKCTKTLCLLFRRHNVLGWIQAVGEGHPASAG